MCSETSRSFGGDVLPSEAIVDAITELCRTEPADVDLVLYDYVDPDALDALLTRPDASDLRVEFSAKEFDISLQGDGRVEVRKTVADPTAVRSGGSSVGVKNVSPCSGEAK